MWRNYLLSTLLLLFCSTAFSQQQITAAEAKDRIGEVVTVCGKIFSAKYLPTANNQPTLLNMGGNYPRQLLTVAIFESDRKKFPFKPEEYYPDQEVCVTGKIVEYRGMPEIVVQSPDQIVLHMTNNTKTELPPVTRSQITPATPASTEGTYDVTLTHDVHIRQGPGLDYAPITILLAGSTVSVIRSNNGWSYVSIKRLVGTPGSANMGYIKNNVLR